LTSAPSRPIPSPRPLRSRYKAAPPPGAPLFEPPATRTPSPDELDLEADDPALEEALLSGKAAVVAILSHASLIGAAQVARLRAAIEPAADRSRRDALHLHLIGDRRAGKRTLLDALIGQRLLGAAPRIPGRIRLRGGAVPTWTATLRDGEVLCSRIASEESRLAEAATQLRALRTELAQTHARIHQAHNLALLNDRSAIEATDRARAELADASAALSTATQAAAQAALGEQAAAEAHQQALVALPGFLREPNPGLFAALLTALLGWIWTSARAVLPERIRSATQAHLSAEAARATLAEQSEQQQQASRSLDHARARQTQLRAARQEAERAVADIDARLTAAGADEAEARQRVAALRAGRAAALREELTGLLGGPRAAEIALLELRWPMDALPTGLVLVDDGNLDTADDRPDAVALLVDPSQRPSAPTLERARAHLALTGSLIVAFTKTDRHPVGPEDEGALAEALGCAPAALLSLSLRAGAALRSPPEAPGALGDLFVLARRDRGRVEAGRLRSALSLLLAAQAHQAARVAAFTQARAVELAALSLVDRPATRAAALAGVEPLLDELRALAPPIALQRATTGLGALRDALRAELAALPHRDALQAWVSALPAQLDQRLRLTLTEAHPSATLAEWGPRLDQALLQGLMERYDLADRVTALDLGEIDAPALPLALGPGTRPDPNRALRNQGAAAGAVLGSLVFPGVGPVLGALLGSVAHRLLPLSEQKLRQERALVAWFEEQSPRFAADSAGRAQAAVEALAPALPLRLDAELDRFEAWLEARREEAAAQARREAQRATAAADDLSACRCAALLLSAALNLPAPDGALDDG